MPIFICNATNMNIPDLVVVKYSNSINYYSALNLTKVSINYPCLFTRCSNRYSF